MSDAVIIMYAICSLDTCGDALDQEFSKLEYLKDCSASEFPCYLVGNKCDLGTSHRVVSTVEMEHMAIKYGCKCAEASAKDGTNVDIVVNDLIVMIMKYRAWKGMKYKNNSRNNVSSTGKCEVT